MKNYLLKMPLLLVFIWFTPSVEAQWGIIKEAVKKSVKVVKGTVATPVKTSINVVKASTGKRSPKSIYKPILNVARDAGDLGVHATTVTTSANSYTVKKAIAYAGKVGGKPGQFIFDVGTFMQQHAASTILSGAKISNKVLHGQNPLQIVSIPLAAAIHAARERYISTAKPLPADVKAKLRPYFDQATLDRARYTVGSVEITLPNFINWGQRFFKGENSHAVTVDDVIVFSVDPGENLINSWFLHELTHVEQYTRWGVEKFALKYLINHSAIEAEAINKANTVLINYLY